MKNNIKIKEASIDIAIEVNNTITEFGGSLDRKYFENRYRGKKNLILVTYVDNKPAGYMVSYDRYNDGSFYCWMTGINPLFRRLGLLNTMMQYLDDWTKKHGYKKISIKTRNNRREMLAYLVKYGFNFTEIQSKTKIENNRILLEKNL